MDMKPTYEELWQRVEELEAKTHRLQEREKWYREIFNATNDAIFIHEAATGEILDVNQTMLDMYGYSHAEALEISIADLIAISPPDLVIVDFILPDGQGTEMLAASKEDRAYPIIVMTSHGDESVAVQAMKGGALDYVVKSDQALMKLWAETQTFSKVTNRTPPFTGCCGQR